MSKELPYFRFTASEWLNDDISLESYEVKGVFADICAYYWFRDCSITKAMLEKRFSNALPLLNDLLNAGIIKYSSNSEEYVKISFLDDQYDQLSELRKHRQEAGSKGGKQGLSKPKAKGKQNNSYKDKDKDKDNILLNEFWNSYHFVTGLKKTDYQAALKYWNKLSEQEQQKAFQNIKSYYDSLNDKKYCKKARTYLADKNFNDEFKVIQPVKKEKVYRDGDLIPNPDFVDPGSEIRKLR